MSCKQAHFVRLMITWYNMEAITKYLIGTIFSYSSNPKGTLSLSFRAHRCKNLSALLINHQEYLQE